MTAVAWIIDAKWLPSDLVHSPIVTDNYTFSDEQSNKFGTAQCFSMQSD